MNTLEEYKELAELFNKAREESDYSIGEVLEGDIEDEDEDKFIFVVNGKTFNLNNWSSDRTYSNGEGAVDDYWWTEDGDKYGLHISAYYNSWTGTEWEEDEVSVVKLGERVVKYVTFTPI